MAHDAMEEVYAKAARQVAEHALRVVREPALDTRPVEIARYPHIDENHFERCTAALTAQGFRVLRDLDARNLVEDGAPHPLIRVLLDEEGTTSAAVMHVTPKSPGFVIKLLLRVLGQWVEGRVVELWTMFADGILSTSNMGDLNAFSPPPWMDRRTLPLRSSVEEVLEAHRAAVAERLRDGSEVRAFVGFDDLNAAREENRQRSNSWRREIGGLLPEEIDRLLAPHGKHGARVRPHLERELAARVAVLR